MLLIARHNRNTTGGYPFPVAKPAALNRDGSIWIEIEPDCLYGITRVLHGISAWSILRLINVIVLVFDGIHFILAFSVWVLRKVQFTGLLLLIGTALFLASKAITIIHALHELNGRLPFLP